MSTINEQKTETATKSVSLTEFSTGQVTSADGITIGYRQIGSGPGLVLMHGGGRASQHYMRLAKALSDSFTVYIPDRRGRGLSGPPGDNYGLQKELEDIEAILQKSGARRLFGHSAGGFFALETALKFPIDKLALYEPAVSINGSLPLHWLPPFEQALDRKDYTDAAVIFLKGLDLHPMTRLPAWFLAPFARLMLQGEDGREMIELFPTLVHEVKIFQQPGHNYERYQDIKAKTLLFGGARSPGYLRQALRVLAKTISQAWLIELPKLDHNAPDQNAPEVVAVELRHFFL